MKLITRLIVIAVLAAFAASSIAHAAGSAAMTADMIATNVDLIEISDCENCDDADGLAGGLTCDFVCSSGGFMAAFVPETTGIALRSGESLKLPSQQTFQDLVRSPEKHPPKTII